VGLTIHYNYQTNKKTSVKQAEKIANDMWNYALMLKDKGALEEVSDLFYITDEEFKHIRGLDREERFAHPLGWAAIQATEHFSKKIAIGKSYRGKKVYKNIYRDLYPEEGWMFTTYPGDGSEEANFGLMRYPSEIILGADDLYDFSVAEPLKELTIKTGYKGWSWGSFCKTQYASNYGLAHFAECHIAVCAMLDNIYMNDRLNIEVSDEGEFWEKRDVQALINEVGDWNRMIGAFAGAMLDMTSLSEFNGVKLEAPILNHPDFEVLETEGRKQFDNIPGNNNLIKVLSEVLKLKEVESKLPKDEK
jgi:hypothetical protein